MNNKAIIEFGFRRIGGILQISEGVIHLGFSPSVDNAAINSSGAHQPPGNRGAFAHVVSPGGGALANFIAARGLCISIPRGEPPGHLTRVLSKDE